MNDIKSFSCNPMLMTVKAYSYNPIPAIIKGCWYKMKTSTGEFKFWVSRRLTRKELLPVAWEYIGKELYELGDIDSVRLIRGESDVYDR